MSNIISGNLGYKGEQGVSPTVSVTKENGTATIAITDKDGTKTFTLSDGEMTKAMVIDNLISTLTDQPLSAKQGKILNDNIASLVANLITTQNYSGEVTVQAGEIVSIAIDNMSLSGYKPIGIIQANFSPGILFIPPLSIASFSVYEDGTGTIGVHNPTNSSQTGTWNLVVAYIKDFS